MINQGQDKLAVGVFVGLCLILVTTSFQLIKSTDFKSVGKIELKKDIPQVSPTVKPTAKPTAKPTVGKKPTVVVTKTPLVCNRINVTESEFVSNKCYSQSDYNTLVSVLAKYNGAKSKLKFAQASIDITCNCENERACEFFKDSCVEDQEDKAAAEADLNLYRAQINLLIARGW